MKRMLPASLVILSILYSLLPLSLLIGAKAGYYFTLRSYPVSIVLLAVISCLLTALLVNSNTSLNGGNAALAACIVPLSSMNGICYIFSSAWAPTFWFAVICCGCASVLMTKYTRSKALKIVSSVLSTIMILLLLFCTFFDFMFMDFSCDTIVKSIPSPENTYVAEVIDNDQGAFGGSTIVDIRSPKTDINFFFGKFSKPAIRIHAGVWDAYKDMEISWKDEETLLIDNKEHEISNR